MNMYLILPVLTGITIVSQAMLNRAASATLGLTSTVFINGIVFFAACTLFWLLVKAGLIPLSGSLGAQPLENLGWKNIIPGLCGVVIVVATPLALMHLGAALTFSIVIATQLILGMLIDVTLQGKPLTWPLATGAIMMFLGCLLILNADKLQR
ncbi:DMT family transporter [Bdellovibrio svalbardensis]|uniref:DMT family transporter n=1 Tax=Bdellovibrio svalbardensis TaxID=2972972 RepID=A0ABT6DI64_9BACT|nr:DMT family transporter [Bdellovibrio svalbardensis]MDG0815536.1 DMT family transporter [Bdellovibrio svalbardensis]